MSRLGDWKMRKLRLQHYRFTHQAVLSTFLTNPENFIQLFEENGKDFLDFLWRCSGEDLEEDELVNDDGLAFEIRIHNEDTKIALITLPLPQSSSEAFIIGLAYNPKTKQKRAFTVEYCFTEEQSLIKVINEWNVDGSFTKINSNGGATLKHLYSEICMLIN